MSECLFCQIVAGKIPCTEVHNDENFLAFRDISPQAPTHILVIPKRHIGALSELDDTDGDLMGRLLLLARKIAADEDLNAGGFRCVINNGHDGGQTVDHIHLHLLGGRPLGWPPG